MVFIRPKDFYRRWSRRIFILQSATGIVDRVKDRAISAVGEDTTGSMLDRVRRG